MSQVIIYIAMSLDGYIGDVEGRVDWLGGDGSDPNDAGSYPEFIKTIDTVIMGRKTYDQVVNDLSPQVWPYEDKQTYVMTHETRESISNVIFTHRPIETIIESEISKGHQVWVCGGASLIETVMEKKLVDCYHITIIPVLLGKGISLFKENKGEKLRLVKTQSYNGMVDLIYEKRD